MSVVATLLRYGEPPTLAQYQRVSRKGQLQGGFRERDPERLDSTPNRPLVSIVTVVRNGAKTIADTIESVRAQSYAPLEYIIIDGASTDGTPEIIRAHEDIVAFWLSEPDTGIYDGFNKGVAASTGSYIGILNSDDWLSKDQISRAVETLLATGGDFVFGDIWWHYGPNHELKYFSAGDPDYGRSIQKTMPRLYQTTALCSRRMFEAIGLFRTSLRIASDYDWFLRAHLAGMRGVYDPRIVGNMRQGGISTTRRRLSMIEASIISIKNGYPWWLGLIFLLKELLLLRKGLGLRVRLRRVLVTNAELLGPVRDYVPFRSKIKALLGPPG